MSEIFFVRHAETDMAGRFCGHSDPALNEQGRAQLGLLARLLSAQKLESVYSSDLQRAISTADAIAAGRNIALRPALREIHFGRWEGRSWDEIAQSDPVYARDWMTAYPHLPAPAGESFQAFETRVLEEVSLLTSQPGTMAVVTHAGVLRVILRHLFGRSESEAWQQTQRYCCIVHYKGEHQ